MKTKFIPVALAVAAFLWLISVHVAYHRGYRNGGDAERRCWTLDPAPTEAWLHGEITARRDTRKHPFLKARIDPRANPSVNSFPVIYSP